MSHMTSRENFDAAREARDSVAARTSGETRHERAMQRYLLAESLATRPRGSSAESSATAPETMQTAAPAAEETGQPSAPAPADAPTEAAADPADRASAAAPHRATREHPEPGRFIVVGVDGSPGSLTAIDWAAAEAQRRDAALKLVFAYALPPRALTAYDWIPPDFEATLEQEGHELVEEVGAVVSTQYPSLDVRGRVVNADAVEGLRLESEGAVMTVVGSRGSGRLSGVLLGSVALAVASSNPAPVAVVHQGRDGNPHGPVVVGVDGSPVSEAALAFAFEEAAVRRAELVAVHTWIDGIPDGFSASAQTFVLDPVDVEQSEAAQLSERLAGWREKYPDVAVQRKVLRGRPTSVLLEESNRAQLVVLGSRGRGGFAGMLLGSTSHALITHAECPVVVVRSP